MMLSNSLALPRLIPTAHHPPRRSGVELLLQAGRRRGISVVTRAGPTTTTYIFALVFPLSLLAVTVFTSARIADKLDQKFLEELAVNQAILETEEGREEEEDDEIPIPISSSSEEGPPPPVRRRNRPKRQVERETYKS